MLSVDRLSVQLRDVAAGSSRTQTGKDLWQILPKSQMRSVDVVKKLTFKHICVKCEKGGDREMAQIPLLRRSDVLDFQSVSTWLTRATSNVFVENENVFAMAKCIFSNGKMYLSKLKNAFSQIPLKIWWSGLPLSLQLTSLSHPKCICANLNM